MSNSSDKVKREIEELLDNLDTFVPEERLASKIRSRRREASGPGIFERFGAKLRRISLGHMMIAGLALLLLSWFSLPYANWMMIAGLLLTIGAFVLSIMRRGGSGTPVFRGSSTQKRWRGQVIDYSPPSAGERLRGWFRGLRRR